MAGSDTDSSELKRMLKEALVEVLEERRDLFEQIVAQAIEDAALGRAIREGEQSGPADRDEVFSLLRPGQ